MKNITVSLNITITDAASLREVLGVLRQESLFEGATVTTAASATPQEKATGNLNERNKARLTERGISRAPRARAEELTLRQKYESEHGVINWYDLPLREKVMLALGYDIYAVPITKSTSTKKEEISPIAGLKIDFSNPPVD